MAENFITGSAAKSLDEIRRAQSALASAVNSLAESMGSKGEPADGHITLPDPKEDTEIREDNGTLNIHSSSPSSQRAGYTSRIVLTWVFA